MALFPNSLGVLIGYFSLNKLLMNEANPQCWKTPKTFNMLDHLMLHICRPMSGRKYNTVEMWKARWRQNFMLEVLINVRPYAPSSPQVCDYLAIATGGNTYDSYYPFWWPDSRVPNGPLFENHQLKQSPIDQVHKLRRCSWNYGKMLVPSCVSKSMTGGSVPDLS